MKKLLLFFTLIASTLALAQGFNAFQQTTFTTVTTGATLVENTVIGFNQLSWTVSGTVSTCTVSLDSSPDGSTWTVGGVIAGQTCTSNGNSAVTAGSANFMRVNMTAISGAGATVVVTYKGWVVNPSGGGGSGTVSANNGVVNAIATYAAAGGSTTIAPAANTACIPGATSGSACLTAPAVAGTSSNPIVSTNAISLPAGTNSLPGLALPNGTGIALLGGGQFQANGALHFLGAGGNFSWYIGTNASAHALIASNGLGEIGWSSVGEPVSGSTDLNLSEAAASLLSIGSASGQGNEGGLWRSANGCRVAADITLPVNTATTVCSWSIPAIARNWAWQCQIPWIISAGTGTNTLAIIANASQTPAAATTGSAEIKTTNTNTATEATTAISASGATTLLTSGTITPAATIFMSSTSGVLAAPATAGTFSIQMTAAGTTVTALAKAGANCLFY